VSVADLRQLIGLWRPEPSLIEGGGETAAFVEAGKAWAALAPIGAGEDDRDGHVLAKGRYRLRVRGPCPAQAGWRVSLRASRMLAVLARLEPIGGDGLADLICVETDDG